MAAAKSSAPRPAAGVSFAAKLTLDDIRHAYAGGQMVLGGVSIDVAAGKVLCLLGPSGSGKSTLLRIIAGIERQTAGKVLLNDVELAGPSVFLPPERRPIGMVFQDYALFPHLTVLENVRFGLVNLRRTEGIATAMRALERVGLVHHAGRYPRHLSGGEQQRVALARAIAPRPQVMLLDEPFSGLDSRLRHQVRSDLLTTLKETRATAIIVTHDAEEAMLLADTIALINKGRIEQAGPVKTVFEEPASLFAAQFMSPVNVLPAVVRDGMVDTPLGLFSAPHVASGRDVTVVFRVGGISPRADCGPAGGTVPARITQRHYAGGQEFMVFAVNGTEVPIRGASPAGGLPADAGSVYLQVDPAAVKVFETRAESD